MENRRIKQGLTLIYKILHGLAPDYLCDMFSLVSEIHNVNTRSAISSIWINKSITSQIHLKAFTVEMAKIYNSIPEDLKKCNNVFSFKNKIHVYLKKQSFFLALHFFVYFTDFFTFYVFFLSVHFSKILMCGSLQLFAFLFFVFSPFQSSFVPLFVFVLNLDILILVCIFLQVYDFYFHICFPKNLGLFQSGIFFLNFYLIKQNPCGTQDQPVCIIFY